MAPRTYTVRAVTLALGVRAKWTDNLLSHHEFPGVERSRQGIERRVTDQGLLAIEFARILNLELGVSMERAAAIAREMVNSRTGDVTTFLTPSGLSLHFSVAEIAQRLRGRMMDALEATARRPRGRPRHSP